jgi:hypothetical protein
MEQKREIRAIAREIEQVWRNKYFGAIPYLSAMHYLTDRNSNYGYDSASSIVLYFLSNATTFRGEDAKRIKKELKEAIK